MTATAHDVPPSSSPVGNRATSDAEGPGPDNRSAPLALVPSKCFLCDDDDAEPWAVGEDFDHRTSPDTFLAMRCRRCGLIYLNPWPAPGELGRIHRPTLDLVGRVSVGDAAWASGRIWARQISRFCRSLPDQARLLDVGCGDGRQLSLVQRFGGSSWRLEGVDSDLSAVRLAGDAGFVVHQGRVEDLNLAPHTYDAALLINVLEHADDPLAVLKAVERLLRPCGVALIATPNTDAGACTVFRGRHWSGYDFPRHRNLFGPEVVARAAGMAALEVVSIRTVAAPAAWVRSVRNTLADWGAPHWALAALNRTSGAALAVASAIEWSQQLRGKGGLLLATLRRPAE